MSLAAVVLAHRDVSQIERLANRLECPVWVHYDAKSPRAEHEQLLRSGSVNLVPGPRRVTWGHWNTVEAILKSLRAVEGDPDHVMVLSGQTYPIKPAAVIAERLSDPISYVHHEPLPIARWLSGGLERVQYRWVESPRWMPRRVPHVMNRLGWRTAQQMIRLPGRRPLPPLPLYGGSVWMILHRDAYRYLLDLPADSPLFVSFRRTLCADELFIHTVLANSPVADRLVNDDLHYIKWQHGAAHPSPLAATDLPELKASGDLFARKFSADDPLLDVIDSELLGVPR